MIFATLAILAGRTALAPIANHKAAQSALAAATIQPATTTPDVYPVAKVIDGDTIDVVMDAALTRIRIIGLDTPEIVDPRKPVQCFAREASDEGHKLLDSQYVRLEYDASQDTYDKYGRTLAYVFLLNGTNYEKFMIENGFGHEYTYRLPYKYQAEFKAAEQEAQAAKRGLWADGVCLGNTTKQST